MFDWPRFLTAHNIEFRREGADNVAVRCPFCGEADQSKNMAISTKGRGWHCWRAVPHAGKNNARLIQAMLRCSWEEAQTYSGKEPAPSANDADLGDVVRATLGTQEEVVRPRNLELPKEFKVLNQKSVFARPFWNYIEDRDFVADEVQWLINAYDLRYVLDGYWHGRIIIPITDASGKLMTWTGRSIQADAKLRYQTLPVNPSKYFDEVALAPPGDLLLGLSLLWACPNPQVLVLCEGPFDALKISAVGRSSGVYGTCLFGLRLSEPQAYLLEQLATRFPKVRLLLDEDAELRTFGVVQRLASVRCKLARLPAGVKDPGALPFEAAVKLVEQLRAA